MTKKTIDFSKYSSIKIGPVIDVNIIENIDEMSNELFIVGGANNLLVSPIPPQLAMLSKKFSYINIKDNHLYIGAATPSGRIFSFAKKHNLANFEYFSKLPGTLGGMLKMNAGIKEDEVFNHLIKIKTAQGCIPKEKINYDYRYTNINTTIFEAVFEIKQGFNTEKVIIFSNMRKNQPSLPSAGSCFKNPPNDYAGRLIEQAGLKGKKIGDMSFSEVHANFLVNHGNGTYKEAMKLIKLAKTKVLEMFGVKLENEILIVDEKR